MAPALLDRYLARTGYSSQQTGDAIDPHRADNLWSPADGPDGHDYGSHGIFDKRSHSRSPQMWASHHPVLTAATATAGAAGLVGVLARIFRR